MTVPSQIPVVLITGASGGLGRALVTQFRTDDFRVVAASRQAAADSSDDRVTHITMNVSDSVQVDAAVGDVLARFGRIDCLINNAGVACDGLSWQLSDDEWDRAIDVNLKGAFRCARSVARQMLKQRDGHIINVSSHAGRAGARGQANYAAAKAGLLALTQSLARELGSRNVRVNAVLPGVLPTKMTASLKPEQMEAFAQANVLGRINSVEEVARFISFLVTTRNISGQVFQLDSRIVPWM